MTTGLSIQETAERTGLTAHTLRYYERIGLVWEVYRDAAGHRRYTEEDVGWLVLLTRLRATGMRVRDMLRYAELARNGPETFAARCELLEEQRARVQARIAELQSDLDLLDYKITAYRAEQSEQIPARESA
jgi:DNA-binding transcriptional MerR regulator